MDVIPFLKRCVYAGSTLYRTAIVNSARSIGECSRKEFNDFVKYELYVKIFREASLDNHVVHFFLDGEDPFYLLVIEDKCYLSKEIIWGVY